MTVHRKTTRQTRGAPGKADRPGILLPFSRLLPALLLAAFLFTSPLVAVAAEAAGAAGPAGTRVIKAGVHLEEPFGLRDSTGDFSGMAVELWEMVERNLGLETRYVVFNEFGEMLEALRGGEIDIIATHVSVTYKRAQDFKFSFPWFDSGLRIMVLTEQQTVWEELTDSGKVRTYAWLAAIMVGLTILITLIRRRVEPEFTNSWAEGLAKSFHDLILAAKSGEFNFKLAGWFSYILSAIWMLFGVALIAYILSTVTSAMTTVSLRSDINGVYDLPGRKIAVAKGSIEEAYLAHMGIDTVPCAHLDDAVTALRKREVQAVVAHAPELEYLLYKRGSDKLRVVGNIFYHVKYAFAGHRSNRALIDQISLELIRLQEQERISELKEKYFGPEQ